MECARVDATLLNAYQGKTVRIIGKVVEVRSSSQGVLFAEGPIQFEVSSGDSTLPPILQDHYYEAVGQVGSSNDLRIFTLVDFGEDLSEKALGVLVKQSQNLPELFGGFD
ncbi:unnamed protein product [Kuraishia capsulata CBS 1993]|uniref:Replication factor A protein 3 n=1 Tax=Kuraishia capsulata CBS 1993 TaxID=1382522 RepID=W6MU06_9ASCO|nr:uncharacterized protein KUCA_T00004782001 [Kuraishia capsulata CBS 1993]CDK28797.1 unnamed protein product [Kuraishia capsulata CBS 1993]